MEFKPHAQPSCRFFFARRGRNASKQTTKRGQKAGEIKTVSFNFTYVILYVAHLRTYPSVRLGPNDGPTTQASRISGMYFCEHHLREAYESCRHFLGRARSDVLFNSAMCAACMFFSSSNTAGGRPRALGCRSVVEKMKKK